MEETVRIKLEKFFSQYKPMSFKKGEMLIRADDEPAGVYFLRNGLVKQYYIGTHGGELTLNMFKPHAFFPMSWVVAGNHSGTYFEALSDCTTWRAPKTAVQEFVKKEPDVLYDLLRRVYSGIAGVWLRMESFVGQDVVKKVGTVFFIFAKRWGKQSSNSVTIDLRLTEQEIASYAAVSRETVSRVLSLFKKKKLLSKKDKRFIIQNLKAFEEELFST